MTTRQNQWFILNDGIAREVITADIQRYLGPDALVRPGVGTGEYQGQPGYWITAYRTLTSQMIQDLKLDSERWRQERQPGDGRGVAYENSQTHASRQHWGPSQPYDSGSSAAYTTRVPVSARTGYEAGYNSTSSHYTHTAAPTQGQYGSSSGYGAPNSASAPRTTVDPYYQQRTPPDNTYAAQPAYAYPTQSSTNPYERTAAAATQSGYPAAPSTQAAPGYYIASDGRQYPLSQQPQTQTQPQQPQQSTSGQGYRRGRP